MAVCYKDRTFCKYYLKCSKGETCPLAATPQLFAEAKDFGLPVMIYAAPPGCFIQKK